VRPALEVADIVRAHGDEFRRAHATSLSPGQKRVLRAIELCRTAALTLRRRAMQTLSSDKLYGASSLLVSGHLERCDQCGHERNAYNSCVMGSIF
jgi:hypothetical protein